LKLTSSSRRASFGRLQRFIWRLSVSILFYYLLYYKCGSIYFSLQRYTSTLKNFKKVLSLISSDFNNVHLI
ncbi:hypothetical protein BJ165DRAFT_1493039, partial [Panaeolus papilionaceus]